ncbi:MAG: hypothetical protein MI674_02095 [Cytophagales bacterium]|nr:hypothetical protein [Cytophagales bacterium]
MKLLRKMHTKKINKFYFFLLSLLMQFSVSAVGAIGIVKIDMEKAQGQGRTVRLSKKNDLVDSIGPIANQIADQKNSIREEIGEESINWRSIPSGSDTEVGERLRIPRAFNSTKKRLSRIARIRLSRGRKLTSSTIDTIDNHAKSPDEILPETLKSDAEEIFYEEKGKQFAGSNTILCAALLQKEGKQGKRAIKKFVFCNTIYMKGTFKKKAESLHYHVVKAEQAHAEGEFVQFLMKRTIADPAYTHVVAMGCSRPYCAECNVLLTLVLGSQYLEISGNINEDTLYDKYYIPRSLRELIEDLTGLKIECEGRFLREITERKRGGTWRVVGLGMVVGAGIQMIKRHRQNNQ